jgi:hypothetical protein
VLESEAPIAPETACPRGGSSGNDILCFGTDGDVKTVMSGRLAREEICGDREGRPRTQRHGRARCIGRLPFMPKKDSL